MEVNPFVGGGFKLTAPSTATASDLVKGSRLAAHANKAKSRSSNDTAPRFVILKPAVALLYYETDRDPADRPKGLLLLAVSAAGIAIS